MVGPTRRGLLAILLLHAGEVLTADRLIDELWGERAPATAAKSLQVHVWRLRKALGGDGGEGPLVTHAGGYVLRVAPGQLDLEVFERLLAEGRAALSEGRARPASVAFAEALALWRGPALAEFGDRPFAREASLRLEELRLEAVEARVDADLQLGRERALTAELEGLVAANPLRERLRAQQMLALYRCGRQTEALAVYRETRKLLDEELGLEPGTELSALERAVLAHDPSLDLAPAIKPQPTRSVDAGGEQTASPADPDSSGTEQRAPSTLVPDPALQPSSRATASERVRVARRGRRGGVAIAAGAALLLAAIAATAAMELTRSSPGLLQVASNSVAAIDTRSNHLVAAIPVGTRPGAIASGSGSLWVANVDDQTVSRVDPTSLRTIRALPMGYPPTGIAASAGAVWVVGSNPDASSVSVSRIDPQFYAVAPGAAIRVGNVVPGGPGEVAAKGDAVWVAPSSGVLTRLNARTGRVVQRIDPNAGPAAIDIGDGAVWVTDMSSDNVVQVDPSGLVTPIAVGGNPSGIAVGAGGVWVADSLDDTVKQIDPNSRSVTSTISVGRSPAGVAVGAGSVWVADSGDGTVTRIDPRTDKVQATITVGGSPQAITIADGRAWVTVDAAAVTPGAASGGTLRVDSPFPVDYMDPDMDPARAYTSPEEQLLYATCAKLLNYPDISGVAGRQLKAEVASSLPTRSADGKTYTFTIRRGFRFSPPSDQPVTAQTFEDTIERTLNPEMRSPFAGYMTDVVGARPYMAGMAGHITGIVARGNKLTIRLTAPAPDFVSRIALPGFCAVPSGTPIDTNNVPIASAGPYYVSSYTPGQGVGLVRNPNYRGSRPRYFDRIVVTVDTNIQRSVDEVERGAADSTSLVAPGAALTSIASRLAARYGAGSEAAAHGRQRYFVNPGLALDFFDLNTHRRPFSDVRLRQAVNYAIDRPALARLGDPFVLLPEQPADHYLPPGLPGFVDARAYPVTPDLAKARALAGTKVRTAVLYTCNVSPCDEQAQIVKNDLAKIGVHVEVKEFPYQTLQARIARPGEPFDLALGGYIPDYPDPAAMLTPLLDNSSDGPTLDDPTYQRRLAQAGRLTGPTRYLAYGKLDLDLARNAAPLIAFGSGSSRDFFSARIGCQTDNFYGIDLAALCIRHAIR